MVTSARGDWTANQKHMKKVLGGEAAMAEGDATQPWVVLDGERGGCVAT